MNFQNKNSSDFIESQLENFLKNHYEAFIEKILSKI